MNDSFTYLAFRVADDKQTVSFEYQITRGDQHHQLTETLTFPVELKDTAAQRASLRALHLALGVSYYKIFVSPAITHPYQMNASEAGFWNDVWRGGLGEFLYVNALNPNQLAQFTAQTGEISEEIGDHINGSGVILGIGGGKDSVVAGELLKSLGLDVHGFVMATGEQRGQAQAVADTMHVPLHVVERRLDKQLLELQEQPGAYKGHIPISLIFGLVGTALAIATDATSVVVANEASASIPRIDSEHGAVNHQWSKSFGFEVQLQRYIQEHVSPAITYFSAIRQLTSVGVAKLFARLPQYFEVFTSDNFVFRIDPAKRPNARWSLESPKSLSSFILLAPWLSESDMLRTFGRNFLDEAELETLFWELTGQQGEPPLDCVGTVEELVLSLNLVASQNKFKDSILMKLAAKKGLITDTDRMTELHSMLALQPDQAVPAKLLDALNQKLMEDLGA